MTLSFRDTAQLWLGLGSVLMMVWSERPLDGDVPFAAATMVLRLEIGVRGVVKWVMVFVF